MSLFDRSSNQEAAGLRWYALHVQTRKEAGVASHLAGNGFECFLPTYKSKRQWSDRMKEVEQPLFPSYLFCRFNFNERRPILVAPGVMQVVGIGKNATPIPDEEICAIRTAVSSGIPNLPWPYIEVGERVRVVCGTLAGVEGILLNFKGKDRVILSVNLLQRSVALEVDQEWLVPVRDRKAAASAEKILQPVPAGASPR